MAFPKPVPGQVIRYSFLWSEEHLTGRDEGPKGRPCVIVLTMIRDNNGAEVVTVLPITHSPPVDQSLALEIPQRTKERLGLDAHRSWIVLSEANQFSWPGPDLRPIPNSKPGTIVYGTLPLTLLEQMRTKFVALYRARRLSLVPRSE